MEGYIGEIRLFGGNFAPQNWALCQGQTLAIASNTALFSILGTTYGGNGVTTFQLPNLAGRVAVGAGNGPGLSQVVLGEMAGVENVTLTNTQMPSHNHALNGASGPGNTGNPGGAVLAAQDALAFTAGSPNVAMGVQSVGVSGGNQPFTVRNPYLGLNYIICMYGIFPSRG